MWTEHIRLWFHFESWKKKWLDILTWPRDVCQQLCTGHNPLAWLRNKLESMTTAGNKQSERAVDDDKPCTVSLWVHCSAGVLIAGHECLYRYYTRTATSLVSEKGLLFLKVYFWWIFTFDECLLLCPSVLLLNKKQTIQETDELKIKSIDKRLSWQHSAMF